ncbi:MAG: hypothetical protein WDZ45_02895 [Flavobacteriaceae bacterium]
MQCNPFEIVYFPNFIFKNGATPKAKFFIALKILDEEIIVVSLPTSKDFVPDNIKVEGCIEYPDKCISCFCFLKNTVICKGTGFKFNVDTFIYSNSVDTYSLAKLIQHYPVQDIDYFIKGALSEPYKTNLLNCLKNSHDLKRKIKKIL